MLFYKENDAVPKSPVAFWAGTFGWFTLVLLLTACAKPLSYRRKRVITTDQCIPLAAALSRPDSVNVQYLGCGGLLVRQGKAAVLFDPFFSNPGPFLLFPFTKLRTDHAMIDKVWNRLDTGQISAVLVTHAHYDHLMDVPYVHRKLQGKPIVYGSTTTCYTLQHPRNAIPVTQLADVEAGTAPVGKPRKWYYPLPDSSYRFMPILSGHAPHMSIGFLGIDLKLFEGSYNTIPRRLTTPNDWKGGATLSYLLDFMDTDKKTVKIRLSVTTSACGAPAGFLPRLAPKDEHPVDIAILGVASHGYVAGYPTELLQHLNPRFVVATHWEDFFSRYDRRRKRGVRFTNLTKFTAKMKAIRSLENKWMLPEPLTKITFLF